MKSKATLGQSLVVIALALSAPLAFADDNGMSRLTGDSYAYFNGLDYHPGGFNTPRAPAVRHPDAVVKTPQRTHDALGQPMLLAERPRGVPTSPFTDDKGA